MNKSETIGALAGALSKAQAEIRGAVKDTANPFFKSKYADLSSVWEACREPLAKNGLSIVQTNRAGDGRVIVETLLMHASGEWISGELDMRPVKDDPQGVGSAITYARRYSLAAMVGVAPEDDDGNAASGKTRPDKVEPQPDPVAKQKLEAVTSLEELQSVWTGLTKEQRESCTKVKDTIKTKLAPKAA